MNFQMLDTHLRNLMEIELLYKSTDPVSKASVKEMQKKYHPSDKFKMLSSHIAEFSNHPYHFLIKRHERYSTVPAHSHDWFEIQYVYSGSCRQQIGDQQIILSQGQFLCLDSDMFHSMEYTRENDIIINLLLKKDYFKNLLSIYVAEENIVNRFIASILSERISHERYILVTENESLHFLFRYLLCEYYSPSINSATIYENTISLILSEITNISESHTQNDNRNLSTDNMAMILKYINSNFQTCSLKSTADFFRISPNYLTRLIKKSINLTYKELIRKLKLNYAENLLRNTALPIETICHEAGYENQSYFYEIFRQKNHCSPKEYRSNC